MNERFSFDSFKSKPNEYFTWNISSAFLFDLFKNITYSAVNMHANEICNVKYARQEHWNVGITQYEIGNGDSIMAVEVRRTVCSLNTVKENQIWQFDGLSMSQLFPTALINRQSNIYCGGSSVCVCARVCIYDAIALKFINIYMRICSCLSH